MASIKAQAHHQRVRIRGYDVDIRTYGAGARNVVLVHGIGASGRYFSRLVDLLAQTCTVHTLEMPGFGSAPKPSHSLDMAGFAAVNCDALRAAGIGPAQWVGHSMGCQVVTEMALLAPDLVTSVVLLSPTINRGERNAVLQGLRLAQDCLREPPAVNWMLLTDYLRAGPRWYLRTMPKMVRHRLEQRIGGVEVPVTLIRGGRDPIVPARWLQELAAARPGAVAVELPGQPHVCMFTEPARTAALLREAASGQ
ncbi:alpha/beta hydrolase [Arthrobacter sp. zg-Y1219]|uniref:alpha/beta fold hydrolase n=1 Tax=Arthrobacter sp. zg-Y1219 TaxID=3049067 RepID=UPI0024C46792|nr:alpha/beta hydrolase [Arthrobacter sp. zg-Y1219]MDK1359824.1 alpha/beta hydrolase [Arthrobacter sp. zg-Y1219]